MKHLSEPSKTNTPLNRIMLWGTILGWEHSDENYEIRINVDGSSDVLTLVLSKYNMEKRGLLELDGSVQIGQTLSDLEKAGYGF